MGMRLLVKGFVTAFVINVVLQTTWRIWKNIMKQTHVGKKGKRPFVHCLTQHIFLHISVVIMSVIHSGSYYILC